MAKQGAIKETANKAAEGAAKENTLSPELPPELAHTAFVTRTMAWIQEEGPWWLCSFVFHLVLVCSLALIGGKVVQAISDQAPSFEAKVAPVKEESQQFERFEVGETPVDPTELNTETLTLEKPAQMAQEERYYDDSPVFTERGGGMAATSTQPNLGGLGGFDVKDIGPGPAVKGKGGVGVGVGPGTHPGSGGEGFGFGGRGAGSRKAMLGSGGGTRQSERAVAGALNWLARHQSADGSWSLTAFKARCKDASCTATGNVGGCESAATALALLPFLGAGQTHESKGPYRQHINAGIYFLISNQKPNGDLRMGTSMYSHGLAAIALCECYGMTNDRTVRQAAQLALNFIAEAQDPVGGGWRYSPKQTGDTSVTGWQIMALKSGQMAYLNVNPLVLEKARLFLDSVSSGAGGSMGGGGIFGYMRPNDDREHLTAVGLLCRQYMGMPRSDPAMIEGTSYLMGNQADMAKRDIYYWYYATQVMHNQPGPDWDTWNRKMRRLLIDSQNKEKKCAAGSWDPNTPTADPFGIRGGRLMMTSLAALTLEVYYRYLPLYKLDTGDGGGAAPGGAAAKPAAAKPAEKPLGKPAGKAKAKQGKKGAK